MVRWEGNARGRLERAALDLFREQGYDRTSVAQIAERAGLTERSFYRWFSDKREVLFAGDELEAVFVAGIDAAPADLGPLPTLLTAFAAAPDVLRPRDFLVERAEVIGANPQLRERELNKMAALSEALTTALLRRGTDPQTARLATDLGSAVLRWATLRWLSDEQTAFPELLAATAAELLAVAADVSGVSDVSDPR